MPEVIRVMPMPMAKATLVLRSVRFKFPAPRFWLTKVVLACPTDHWGK